jgi:hypothetical protein
MKFGLDMLHHVTDVHICPLIPVYFKLVESVVMDKVKQEDCNENSGVDCLINA